MTKETFLKKARRVVRFGVKTGLTSAFDITKAPTLAKMVVGAGLNIKTVHALHAKTNPHRIAAVDPRRSFDYATLDRAIRSATAGLRQAGVRRGDPVVVCMENRLEYLIVWFALFRIGAPAVHASYRSTTRELSYLFEHSGATVAFASPDTAERVMDGAPDEALLWVCGDDDSSFWRWLAAADGDDAIDRAAGGNNVVYTSGTTGAPKGAVRDFTTMGLVELSRVVERLPMREGDRHLIVCPLYHSGAQALTLIQTSLGATIYLEPHFEAERTLSVLHSRRIHSIFLVPTMIRRLLELPDEEWRRSPPAELRCVISGAAPFPHALREKAVRRLGASVVHDFYGATEIGWVTLIDGGEMMQREGSVGRPLPGQEIKIADDSGREQPTGEVGTLCVRNDQAMAGYLADEEATSKTRLDGGWTTVDDLARVDEDGYLYLAGRDRDMVISGGVNLYPVEIEEVLARYPGVVEVAVMGVPDEEWGERLEACVVWRAEPDEEGLEEHARGELAGMKVPRRWRVLDELPRNPTGKVLKRELRERFA